MYAVGHLTPNRRRHAFQSDAHKRAWSNWPPAMHIMRLRQPLARVRVRTDTRTSGPAPRDSAAIDNLGRWMLPVDPPPPEALTRRELEIVQFVAQGLTNI